MAALLSSCCSSSSSSSFFVLFFFMTLSSHMISTPVPAAAAAADPSCHPSDLAALRSIAAAFPAPLFNYHSHGNNTASLICCGRWSNWTTVTCSAGRVTGLRVIVDLPFLSSFPLVPITPFPSALCTGLPALTSLVITSAPDVSYPLLSGSLPLCRSSTGHNLTKLQHLDLSWNSLTGVLPPLDPSPPSLLHLDLNDNFITGPIPAQSSFPRSLRRLDLSYNRLIGSIPANSFPRSLQHLDLSGNQLTGSIPHSLSLLQSLRNLLLGDNTLSGTFPSFLANASVFPHLEELYLHSNFFLSGPLPSAFNMPDLASLDLSDNAFSGPVPTFINTPALQSLYLSSNRLSGSLSPLFQYSNLTSLQQLVLTGNYLSRMIPDFQPHHFPDLLDIDLSSNILTGALPSSIFKLSKLSYLGLSSNSFSGHFNMAQCNFTQLRSVDVSHNQFAGPFPEWLGSHRKLVELSLDYNNFSGSLPNSWRNLTSLTYLSLSNNSIIPPNNNPQEPKLPKWLFNISGMELGLSSLQLQAKDLSHCSDYNGVGLLVTLDLSNNNITMDPSRNHMTSFNPLFCMTINNGTTYDPLSLNLSGNPLKLDLNDPNAVKLLPLQMLGYTLDLSSCMLTGHLTSLFFDHMAPSFVKLYLSHNQLEGQIPRGLGNMSNLQILDLSYNSFTGFAPLVGNGFLGLDLSLSNNHLAGDLPSMLSHMFGNISSCDGCVASLDLSHNHLTGAIPPFLGQYLSSSTYKLKLNHNHLESVIPDELFPADGESNLQILSLSTNYLKGPIPTFFSNFKQLVLLDLSHNSLEGSLEGTSLFRDASSLQYAHLRVLNLGYNRFTGTIPTSLGDIAPALQVIDLSNNNFTGSIPSHVLASLLQFRIENQLQGLDISKGSLYEEIGIIVKNTQQQFQYVIEALTSLDLSHNNLSGEISNIGLGKLSGLVYLNLSRNSFSGPLPSDLGNIGRQLQSLDLSFNMLQGPIPQSFQNLSELAIFNVSYNEGLVGPIPQNSPQLEEETSYIEDPYLCGQPVRRACNIPNLVESQKITSDTTLSWFDEWISIPGLCLGFVIGFLGFLYVLKALGLYL